MILNLGFLPIVIDQLHSVVGVTEAKATFDSHAKLTWERERLINH